MPQIIALSILRTRAGRDLKSRHWRIMVDFVCCRMYSYMYVNSVVKEMRFLLDFQFIDTDYSSSPPASVPSVLLALR